MMKRGIFAIATLGVFATFVGCTGETTEVSSTTSSYSTEATGTADATVTTTTVQVDTTTVSDAREQISEGAKMVGEGIREEARQAVAAGGAAMEQAGQALQNKADASAPTPAQVAASDVASGASIFQEKCASCHGADASGNTTIGRKNNIRDIRSSAVQAMTDPELSSTIVNGKSGGMSATAHKSKALTPNQLEDVIAYVRSIRS